MQYKLTTLLLFAVCFGAFASGLNNSTSHTAALDTSTSENEAPSALISLDANAARKPIDARIFSTNLPNWVGTAWSENGTAIARTQAASLSIMRIPGGSESNEYDWLACETGNAAVCGSWRLTPTDFINFMQAAGAEAMYTANQNGTSKEAAALVAFFNGDVNDNTTIGVDVHGYNWQTVGHWAQLRADHGNPAPANVQYWEIGNEIFGGKVGKDCKSYGWEDVWTCDGVEYVNGIGSGSNRKEGYLEFRDAMRAVDSTIKVGAVGVSLQDDEMWTNWGTEVIAEAGDVMDFYVIHKYAYSDSQSNPAAALARPQEMWGAMMDDYEAAYEQAFPGETPPPVAVTEYNLFSTYGRDGGQWMTEAVNMLFMADSLGQMAENGFAIANQWDLVNGSQSNGTDYGMLGRYNSRDRYPQYYAFPMWARFGDNLLPVSSTYDPKTTLSVYAGRPDSETVSVMVINKTGGSIYAPIQIDNMPSMTVGGTVDVVRASSLGSRSVTFNGVSNPSDDLSNAPSGHVAVFFNGRSYTFPPYSITLLRLGFDEFIPTNYFYTPLVLR